MKKFGIVAAVIALALGVGAWTQNSTEIWLKGPVYLGSAKTQLSSADGAVSFSVSTSLTTSITAFATGGQTNATQLSSDYNIITTCATAGDSVKLPAAASGREITVFNSGAAALAVFPGSGDTINSGSANASVTVPVSGVAVFRGLSASAWKVSGGYWVNGGIEFTGATETNIVTVPDNLADAFNIKEGSTSYMKVVTTNSSESVAFTPAVTMASTLAVTGVLTQTVPPNVSVGAAVSAAGSSKTDATALTKEYNEVSGTALQGVSLLTAAAGLHQLVYNSGTTTIIVYPLDAGNDTLAVNDFAALSADVGYAVGPKGSLDCYAYTTTAWHCRYRMGARSTVAAAGTNQATGTALGSATMGSYVAVTAADATKAITLPTGGTSTTYVPGCVSVQSTVNTNTAYLPVFGHNSDDDTINGAAADAVFTMGAGATVTFCSIDGVAWLTK